VTGKYFLAALAQPGPVLHQALLNCSIIAELLSAKSLGISSAGLLLLRGPHVTLGKRHRGFSQQKCYNKDNEAHNDLPIFTNKTCFPSAGSSTEIATASTNPLVKTSCVRSLRRKPGAWGRMLRAKATSVFPFLSGNAQSKPIGVGNKLTTAARDKARASQE
jgi:hypothetical protein